MRSFPVKYLLTVVISAISFFCTGQDYIQYHRTFNKVDEDILSENYALALERLDSIYNTFDFIYAQHCMKSLQICCVAGDSARAGKWLEKCFKQGIPFWIIRQNEIARKSISYSTTQNAINHRDSLYAIYRSNVNTTLANTIDSLFEIDQRHTQKVNEGFFLFRPIYSLKWIRYNKRTFKAIDNITKTYVFPCEKTIGLPEIYNDSASQAEYIRQYGIHLRQWKAYFILLHYFSTKRKIKDDFKDILYENLKSGNISPFQFATICNYIFRYSKHSKNKFGTYNYSIDNQRIEIGLNTMEEERRNEIICRERRKNGKANAEIILE